MIIHVNLFVIESRLGLVGLRGCRGRIRLLQMRRKQAMKILAGP